ncbi:MAG TPA: Hsp20/alpha crystallin family protein [Candidatus Paceibacterota bacterium]|nr:Hsp20/alpha crystallin family protein [Candidatus Paceibacterota bacterium]
MVRKQSFLERLTGAVELEHEHAEERARETEHTVREEAREKPWTEAVYEDSDVHDDDADEVIAHVHTEEAVYEVDPDVEEDDEEEGELAVDLYETESEIIIQSMIAGVTPENLHISVTRDMVSIRGVRVAPSGIPDEHYHIQELYWGAFSREIELPVEIDTDGAEAVEKFGLLIIRLPKLDSNRSQELKVKSI